MSRLLVVAVVSGVLSACAQPETGMVVPEGAKAGDFVGWTPCANHDAPASCGTLIVPERRAANSSRLIALPVVRWRAPHVLHEEPIFWMAGGPEQSNISVLPPDWIRAQHDVVLVGYRGVDGSTQFECPAVRIGMLGIGGDLLSRETRSSIVRASNVCVRRLARDTVDTRDYTVDAVIADLETARVALAYQQISLYVAPTGTRLAVLYAQRHPSRLYRSVMADRMWHGFTLRTAVPVDRPFLSGAPVCRPAPDCQPRAIAVSTAVHGSGTTTVRR